MESVGTICRTRNVIALRDKKTRQPFIVPAGAPVVLLRSADMSDPDNSAKWRFLDGPQKNVVCSGIVFELCCDMDDEWQQLRQDYERKINESATTIQ